MDEILRDLARLRHYGSTLQELMSDLRRFAPERSEGTDPSGAVRAVLGPDGLPEAIRVSPYWKEKVQPAGFGGAVVAACQAAVQQRGAQWSEAMKRSGWQQRLERLEVDADMAAAADPNPIPPAFRRGNGAGPQLPRPPEFLAEEAISALDAVMKPTARPQRARGIAANRAGTLEISLSPAGQVTCRTDPRWVAQQSGAQLTEAIGGTLATARDRLAAAAGQVRAGLPDTAKTDALLAEALAAMNTLPDSTRPDSTLPDSTLPDSTLPDSMSDPRPMASDPQRFAGF
jgi:hypothetical protein